MAEVTAFLVECAAAVGDRYVVTDPDRTATQSVDWTGRWRGLTPAVVRPRSTAEVAAVVRSARRHGVALVAQGGNTGLVGGAAPLQGEVLLDLRRLDRLDPVDTAAAQVTVGAGATLAAVQAHVGPRGLTVGVDLTARDTATIGGMVATNAGGLHVLRHGTMRAQVVGLEAVLGTGDIIDANLAGLVKDNTGYDLAGLLCGSEGTLGIVTAVRLRLVPRPRARLVALLGFRTVADAVSALPRLRSLADLHALELVLADGLRIVGRHLALPSPVGADSGCALLVELATAAGGPGGPEAPATGAAAGRADRDPSVTGVVPGRGDDAPVPTDGGEALSDGAAGAAWAARSGREGEVAEAERAGGPEVAAADGGARLLDELGGALQGLGSVVVESAVADDDAGIERLWHWREAHSEAAAALGLVHKADVSVPLSAMAAFVAAVGPRVDRAAPGATTLVYGHLGDGNVHVNVVGPAAEDDAAVEAVLGLVLDHGGSVSAEHGIGVAKRAWLERQRGSAAVVAMRAIKAALDPDGILNPGVLLP